MSEEAVAAYQATAPWNNFRKIVALTEKELTAIQQIPTGRQETNHEAERIFTLDGKQVSTLQKGVNIIHKSDNTVKKVYVK